jgi:hypothetical protein
MSSFFHVGAFIMSIVSSRESTPLSKGDDEVSDSSLKELLEQEMDLHLQIEAVQEEIGKLEERLGLPNANDLEDEGMDGSANDVQA